MRTLTHCLLIISCTFISCTLVTSATLAEGFYKWKDARGNIQYGDKPPANVKAETMNMPKLTVIENYDEQWKPVSFSNNANSNVETYQPVAQPKARGGSYSSLKFIAPKANQPIRANDGDVSAMISLKPPLKAGHIIAFSLDGKEVAKGNSRTNNFANLPRGNHSVSVKVTDDRGAILKSESVTFTVLRHSKLINDRRNIKPRTNNVIEVNPNQ